ncbi:MAG: RluA family pseudouridine synthase [Oscillospiraceae bacterium]|nr:RluA family pseudouridine synthase [Oscillospiraceae bacterium]
MITILFQDKALAVCLKPPGVLSQDGPGETLPALLREQLECDIFPVHRLDREAGGVMVCAKTSRAAGALSATMSRGEFRKEYLCIVRGCPEEPEGVWKDLLLHDKTRNKSFAVKRMRGGVKEASLAYKVLAEREGLSLALVQLHTGRTHQIRVQFASRGLPLMGDGKYGGGSGQMALWSWSLSFPHPNGKQMSFQSLPKGQLWEPFAGVIKSNTVGTAGYHPQTAASPDTNASSPV